MSIRVALRRHVYLRLQAGRQFKQESLPCQLGHSTHESLPCQLASLRCLRVRAVPARQESLIPICTRTNRAGTLRCTTIGFYRKRKESWTRSWQVPLKQSFPIKPRPLGRSSCVSPRRVHPPLGQTTDGTGNPTTDGTGTPRVHPRNRSLSPQAGMFRTWLLSPKQPALGPSLGGL